MVDGKALVGVEDPALDIGSFGGPPPELDAGAELGDLLVHAGAAVHRHDPAVDGLAQAIEELVVDGALRAELATNGIADIKADGTYDQIYTKYFGAPPAAPAAAASIRSAASA